MRRLMKIMLLSLMMGVATLEASAQPPVPPVPAPSARRVVRDVDATVRRATPVRRRVRRHVRHRRAVRRRATALTLRPPVRGLPVIRLPKPPIPR